MLKVLKLPAITFFDGHVRANTASGGSASFIRFLPNEHPVQLFHMPNERNSRWQAAFSNFGCWPEFGETQLEYVIFVGTATAQLS